MFDKPYIFETWIHVAPADDVPGEWVAHCIANDVISMGSTLDKAIAMAMEACATTVVDDLEHDRDPWNRGLLTPDECREKVKKLIEHGRPVTREQLLDGVASGQIKNVALSATLMLGSRCCKPFTHKWRNTPTHHRSLHETDRTRRKTSC